jgi:hypothetical protein
VESQNYLGIYLSKDKATAICLDLTDKPGRVLGSFTVSVEAGEQDSMQILAGLIAQGCLQRRWSWSEVAVALDCAVFMQHNVHSEFSDPKQIAATIRFDTEEAIATDITDVALAFEIKSSGQEGSELTVFTAQRQILSELLGALQMHNLDPVTIEPDVSCLSRFIFSKDRSDEPRRSGTMFAIISRRNGYLIIPPAAADTGSQMAATVRTFMVSPTQNRTELLAREVLVTTALAKGNESISCLKIFDSAGTVNRQQLGERLGVESENIEWLAEAGADNQIAAESGTNLEPGRPQPQRPCHVDFAVAYGAALSLCEKGHFVNFRDDFSPFQGKKLKMHQALKVAAISFTVLLIAVGMFFQAKLLRQQKDNRKLRAKFSENYSAVMPGEKLKAKTKPVEAVRKLRSEWGRIKAAKAGLITIKGEKSIASKLTLVLKAFNACAKQTDLNIKSLTITARDIIITGDTSSRQNTQRFFEAVRNNGLEILRPSYELKGGRDGFSITVVPK